MTVVLSGVDHCPITGFVTFLSWNSIYELPKFRVKLTNILSLGLFLFSVFFFLWQDGVYV